MVTITIETDNAAFTESPGQEVARILRSLARAFEDSDGMFAAGSPSRLADFSGKPLRDLNGNTVGRVAVTP